MDSTQKQLHIGSKTRANDTWLRHKDLPISEDLKTRIYRALAEADAADDDVAVADISFALISLGIFLRNFSEYLGHAESRINKGKTSAA